jgi:hypothetical protein
MRTSSSRAADQDDVRALRLGTELNLHADFEPAWRPLTQRRGEQPVPGRSCRTHPPCIDTATEPVA